MILLLIASRGILRTVVSKHILEGTETKPEAVPLYKFIFKNPKPGKTPKEGR